LFNGECLSSCPSGYYSESIEFIPCIYPCLTCSPYGTCTSCECHPETHKDIFTCQPCSKACSSCYGPTNSDCIDCDLSEGYVKDNSGKCYPKICTDRTYLDTKNDQCSICGNLCKWCGDDGSCIECVPEALNSIVNDETICSFCPDGYEYKRGRCEGSL